VASRFGQPNPFLCNDQSAAKLSPHTKIFDMLYLAYGPATLINIAMDEILGRSLHYKIANQTLEWFGNDSLENNQYYKNRRMSDLIEFGWVDKTFTYSFNEHGFRSETFTDESSVVFLGASDTLGTGMPLEETWTYIVAKELGLRRYNLGQGGGSGSLCFRLASYWLPILKPKVVIYMSPLNTRYELATSHTGETIYHQLSPSMLYGLSPFWNRFKDKDLMNELTQYYNQWAETEINLTLLESKNKLAISKLADNIDAKFALADGQSDWDDAMCDFARDLIHGGVQTNKNIANIILDRLS